MEGGEGGWRQLATQRQYRHRRGLRRLVKIWLGNRSFATKPSPSRPQLTSRGFHKQQAAHLASSRRSTDGRG